MKMDMGMILALLAMSVTPLFLLYMLYALVSDWINGRNAGPGGNGPADRYQGA